MSARRPRPLPPRPGRFGRQAVRHRRRQPVEITRLVNASFVILLTAFATLWPVYSAQAQPAMDADRGMATHVISPADQTDRYASANPASKHAPAVEHAAPAGMRDTSRPLHLYASAADRYAVSPYLLLALHQVESSGAGDGCLKNVQGSGATGPFQFMPETFKTFGVDGDGDGRADICGLVDGLFSAAHYLAASGANADPGSDSTRRALTTYGTDVAAVISLATWKQEQAQR